MDMTSYNKILGMHGTSTRDRVVYNAKRDAESAEHPADDSLLDAKDAGRDALCWMRKKLINLLFFVFPKGEYVCFSVSWRASDNLAYGRIV